MVAARIWERPSGCDERHDEIGSRRLVKDGKRDVWLPLSQVEMERDSEKTFVTMPKWLAIDKGLV